MNLKDLIKLAQSKMGVAADGDWGPITTGAAANHDLVSLTLQKKVTQELPGGNARNPNWAELWERCEVDPPRMGEVILIANKLKGDKAVYERIGAIANCAWWVPALLNYRESGGRLDTYLHNGQRLGQVTTIEPRGIFFRADQFVEAAVDALNKHGLNGCFQPAQFLGFAERFNGLGYRNKFGDRGEIELSPYVAAGTNLHDETSKYVRDGVYDPNAKELQLGVAAILKGLLAA